MPGERFFDCHVDYNWPSQADLMGYLSSEWREFVGVPDSLPGGAGAIPIVPDRAYHDPLPGSSPAGRAPSFGSVAELTRHVDGREPGLRGMVLTLAEGAGAPLLPNVRLARSVCRAVNQWTDEHWLSSSAPLWGAMVVPYQEPELAAAEMRQTAAAQPRFVEVLLSGSALNKPFGHPAYDPIFRAAAELQLTVGIVAGGDAVAETLAQPAAGGLPATFAEHRVLAAHSLATHLTSVIAQGVLDRYPTLTVMLRGAGVAWLPSVLWRLDQSYRSLRREVPWLRAYPSDYLANRIRVASWPVERVTDGRLADYLAACPALETVAAFGSGAPGSDHDTPGDIVDHYPKGWWERVLGDNAVSAYPRLAMSSAAS